MRSKPWPISRYEYISQLCGAIVVLIGGAALIGWFTGSTLLRGIKANYIPMAPNTALAFILAGGVLGIPAGKSGRFLLVGRLAICFLMALVLARLSEYLTGVDLKADHWIFSFPAQHLGLAPVGKMAFFTAATFLLLGVAILLLTLPQRHWFNDLAKVLGGMVAFVGTTFSLGYLYGAPLMYGGRSIPMALNTAIAFMAGGAGVVVRASVSDILARRRAEAALRRSEERYRLLFESNPLPIWVFDTKTLGFLAVNQAAIDRYGYSREEFLSMTLKDIRPAEDIPTLLDHFSKISSGTEGRIWKHRKKNGELIDVEVTSHPLIFAGKSARVVLSNDITERKRAEEAIKQLNQNLEQRSLLLEQANKELDAFSYSVSHDLRAPLRAIDGFSRILVDDHSHNLDTDALRVLGVIRANTQTMGRLIDDLLAFSRLGRKPIESCPIDMYEMAGDVFAQLAAADSQVPRFELEPLDPSHGDPSMIRQVFANLLSNAAKYSRTKDPAQIRVGSYDQNGEHVYYVKDNGVGFDMSYANKLFGVFQRLHSADEFEGTGVGLAIVQRIIHRHGGRVWAEGKVNEGATFYFTLPKEHEVNGISPKHE